MSGEKVIQKAETVAAVVVTYNRAKLLIECLEGLLRQTRPLQKIVLVDNASSDGTHELLQSRGYLDNPIIDYIRLPTNTGGAGGFHAGVKRAFETGFDWFWLMDDDAEPRADALARMTPAFAREGIAAIANLTVDLQGKPQAEHSGHLKLCGTTLRTHQPIVFPLPAGRDSLEISFASFAGFAVHRHIVERIGLPNRELFIRGDDLDYCLRISAIGPIVLMLKSEMVHKDAISTAFERTKRFGRGSNRVPIEKLWVHYIALRNVIWLRRQHCGAAVAAIFAIRQYLRIALGIILYDSQVKLRLGFFGRAVADGWRGTFDNQQPRKLGHAADVVGG